MQNVNFRQYYCVLDRSKILKFNAHSSTSRWCCGRGGRCRRRGWRLNRHIHTTLENAKCQFSSVLLRFRSLKNSMLTVVLVVGVVVEVDDVVDVVGVVVDVVGVVVEVDDVVDVVGV